MNKSTPILKTVCAATLLAMGLSAQANVSERYIVTYDSNSQGLKKGHQIKAQGKNWFAVELDEKGKSALMAKAGLKNIEVDAKRFPMAAFNDSAGNPNTLQVTPYNYYQIQAEQLTYMGGQKVCVIDSGLALGTGETGGPNADFDTSVITGDNNSGTGNWFEDGGAHGTHVAGTIGALDNNIGVIGMAPGVPMHIIKVFNDAGWGYSSDLAQAANLCAAAGANIINMSLGGGASSSVEEAAFNNFSANGGLVLAAAGNDGNNVRSYPAGYSSIMMIGGVDSDNNKYSGSQFPACVTSGKGKNRTVDDTTCVEVVAGGVDVLSTVPSGTGAAASLTADVAPFATSAVGETTSGTVSAATFFMGTAEVTNSGAAGKICMIDRGNISFEDKVANCENSGGIGAVIINNVDESALGFTLTSPTATTIPAVGAFLNDRASLLAASNASIAVESGDYAKFTGTSMATPTVAGASALIWSNNPNCSGEDIRAALRATAEDRGNAGRDDEFGFGIAKAAAANAYLANSSCGGAPANYSPTASFNFSCTDLVCDFTSTSSDSDGTIASTSWTFGDGGTATGATASHTYAATGNYSVSVSVTDNESASSTSSQTVSVSDGTEPPAGDITLTGTRAGNGRSITLNWNGATSSSVDVYVNGNFNNTTANSGSITYNVNKRTTYTFEVCEEGSTTACSNSVTL